MELKFLGKEAGFGEKNNSAYYENNNTLTLIDCGFTVFNLAKKEFDFNKYENINIIITHLHNDHAGSLSQLILYLWFCFNKKPTILSQCEHIKEYLDITGTPIESYNLASSTENISFIKTPHVPIIDSYGVKILLNNKTILYTGDTASLDAFEPYFNECSELYVDTSIGNSGVHTNIIEILPKLLELKANGVDIMLMHLDNIEKIKNITNDNFNI